jgi:hypothetical protein
MRSALRLAVQVPLAALLALGGCASPRDSIIRAARSFARKAICCCSRTAGRAPSAIC